MSWFLLPLTLLFSLSVFAKSSEIPARREFPVNTEIDPCTDFYQYACSKVIDTFQLREDRSIHDFAFNDSSERLLEAKKTYFSTLTGITPQGQRETILKTYYAACMDEGARAKEEKALVSDVKKQIKDIKDRESLLQLFAKNMREGDESPLRFFVVSNQDRPLFNDLVFNTTWTTLPEKSYYEKPEVVADLGKVVAKFFSTIGESAPEDKAKTVVEFEKGLAKVNLSPVERREVFATRTGISKGDLAKNYGHFQLNALLERTPEHTHIRHISPRSMDFMEVQLGTMPLADLKTIYLYNALYKYLDDAYPEFFNTKFTFEMKNFGGPNVRPDRVERCTRAAMARFTPEIDSILWPKMFPGFPIKKITALAEKIRGSIISSLNENRWLSKAAQKEAIKKIKTATLQLVAPQNDEEWDFRPEGQYDLQLPIHNDKQLTRLLNEKNLNELKGPISPKRWGMGPLTVNAYYNQANNKFVLPVGILQYPFFDPVAPMEVNLAAIGSVFGHELGHGIDDEGSRYDSAGVLRTWMSENDLKGFKERTKILVDQFSASGQNGELTLGENIGDLVGLTAAQRAAFQGKKPPTAMTKAFYTQYARMWCEVIRPKFAELQIKSNPHALSVARVNEQMRQQAPFRAAFACKESNAMVLGKEKLVHIW